MEKKILLASLPIILFLFTSDAYAYDVAACLPCSSCTASYFGKDASCTSMICTTISCMSSRFECEGTYLSQGTSCGSGNTCCSGLCQADPRTDTQCQDKSCGPLGWSATNKADGTSCTYSGQPSTCKSGACQAVSPPTPTCSDNIQNQGETGVDCGGPCPACPACSDSDGGDPEVKNTCYDQGGCKSGCTETCASLYSAWEWYCPSPTGQCKQKEVGCTDGCGASRGACWPSGGGGGGGSAGCAWWSTTFSTCSSGCPSSYADQQQVCCETIGYSECNSQPACASYNPLKGETPCCTAAGYYTCSSDQICTPTGCQSVCTGSVNKTTELYCTKCNHCQDGIQNCGEPSVDRCGEACKVPETRTYTTPGSYGGYTCAAVGNNKCQYYNDPYCVPGGCYDVSCLNLVSCSSGEYGCIWNCQGKTDVFNTASCYDGVQNCAETCTDGGAQCSTGKRETDNSYLITYGFTSPPGLSGTSLYTDAASWNCMDGSDNDHDCLIDCNDPDCASALGCLSDTTPPTVNVGGAPAMWVSNATAYVVCSDDTGCNTNTYRLLVNTTNPGTCAKDYAKYTTASPAMITTHSWICATANDTKNNVGYSLVPVEFKIDITPPNVSVGGVPASWVASASASVVCSDENGCNTNTYRLLVNSTNPGTCVNNYTKYPLASPATITNHSWLCATANDTNNNVGYSVPAEFKADSTSPQITVRVLSDPLLSESNQTFIATCSDSESGCNTTVIRIGTSSCMINHTRGETRCDIRLTAPCEYGTETYTFNTTDQTGNTNGSTGTFLVKKSESCPCAASVECFTECNKGACGAILPLIVSADFDSKVIQFGKTILAVVSVTNPNPATSSISLHLDSASQIKNWMWFSGHKTQDTRRDLNISVGPYETTTVGIDIMGVKVGSYSIYLGPDEDYKKKYAELNVKVIYVNKGLFSTTPDMGASAILLILAIGAMIAVRERKAF